jgi:hypothetical protein
MTETIRLIRPASLLFNSLSHCGDGCCTFNNWERENFPAGKEFDASLEGYIFNLEDLVEGEDFERIFE